MADTAPAGTPHPARRAAKRPKVPDFARYQGTSAWKKHRRRVRAYAWHQAHKVQGASRSGAMTA